MAGFDRSRRSSFEEQADLYDATRSGYPAEVIDGIVELARLNPEGRILEIACGSGQATVAFAERGYPIVGVELGERLAQLAANKLRPFPQAQVIQHEFESWTLPLQPFDLVVIASAFHWLVPEIAIPRIARALVPGGMVAIVGSVVEHMDTPLHRAIAAVYSTSAPDWPNPLDSEANTDFIRNVTNDSFTRVGGFEPLQSRIYPDHRIDNGTHYIEELRTFSSHRAMPEATRRELYAGIRAAFQAHEDRMEQDLSYLLLYTHPLPSAV